MLILKRDELNSEIRRDVLMLLNKFNGVTELKLNTVDFTSVNFSRNNNHYKFAVILCEYIYQKIVLNENKGDYEFEEFIKIKKTMNTLFEKFLYFFIIKTF